jgi:hypothetical protein
VEMNPPRSEQRRESEPATDLDAADLDYLFDEHQGPREHVPGESPDRNVTTSKLHSF